MIQTIKNYIYGGTSQPINLIIGGMGSTITSKEVLMNYLSIPNISRIRRFEIVGNNVHANINGNYGVDISKFESNTSITSFIDYSNLCTSVNRYAFRNCTNLRYVRMHGITGLTNTCFQNCPLDLGFDAPNITTSEVSSLTGCQISNYAFADKYNSTSGGVFMNNNAVEHINFPLYAGMSNNEFSNLPNLKTLILPSATAIGSTSINCLLNLTSCELISMRKMKSFINYTSNGFFSNLKLGCTIEVHIFLATANSGAPAQQLVRAKTTRGAIVKFYDDNGNYVSTL